MTVVTYRVNAFSFKSRQQKRWATFSDNPPWNQVRMEGLEPPHLAASDPKSDVSTNFTTCASFSSLLLNS